MVTYLALVELRNTSSSGGAVRSRSPDRGTSGVCTASPPPGRRAQHRPLGEAAPAGIRAGASASEYGGCNSERRTRGDEEAEGAGGGSGQGESDEAEAEEEDLTRQVAASRP